ncbi:MAG: endonuclease/exonuclease/phosphatase family protein [Actinobacteria bacterium]|nr:endonuclease/exonuclease/phosphatase family protein [Actinomycetota bacterium]
MFDDTSAPFPFRKLRVAIVLLLLAVATLATVPTSAAAVPPEQAERRFTVMTYNVYLGANLQPLFGVQDPLELIARAAAVFAHLDQVDFNVRAVAIAEQIIENEADVVSLQEVSLWQTAPLSNRTQLTTRYDFLAILLNELERQGRPYEAVSVNANFHGELPISFTTLGVFTDRNAIIARTDLPTSELMTSNDMEADFQTTLPVPIGGQILQVQRGWASVDVMLRGKTYRFFDTHFEAFSSLVRLGQVNELVTIMSASPFPVVLAGDLNLFPQAAGRPEDAAAWTLLSGAGFVDAWVEAECFEPRFTAGQTDDLDNVPSILDNTVDYVLLDADFDMGAVEDSCDIAGEELDDRTATVPALWPSDHAAVVVDMHIAKP